MSEKRRKRRKTFTAKIAKAAKVGVDKPKLWFPGDEG